MLVLLSLAFGLAHAGIGDPVDGTPTWVERDLHVWTNAARIAPHAFPKDASTGGCSASGWASTPPTHPLRFHLGLATVARDHSADLDAHDAELTHDSLDGTSMQERIQAVYGTGKSFGENLARGYPTARMAVLSGWMCSDGHRRNLLSPDYDEVGHGVVGEYATQDLGRGGGLPDLVNAASHFPEEPADDVIITTDLWDVQGRVPDAVDAIVDGEPVPLYLLVGREGQGMYQGLADAGAGCTPWYIEVRFGDAITRWPEQGSYAWGDCDFDDVQAGWLDLQVEVGEGPYDPDGEPNDGPVDGPGEEEGEGDPAEEYDAFPWTNLCATNPASASWLLLGLAALGLRRRRQD